MPDPESITRQEAQDREYLAACREHGIQPDLPRYRSEAPVVEAEALARFAESGDGVNHNGQPLIVPRNPPPLSPLSPEAEGAQVLLDVLLAGCVDKRPAIFVRSAGRRLLVLAWMLGHRRESMAELGRSIGVSRASLSAMCRKLEDRLGIHGRGQKGAHTPEVFADNARKSWKLRRLNSMLAEAVAEP